MPLPADGSSDVSRALAAAWGFDTQQIRPSSAAIRPADEEGMFALGAGHCRARIIRPNILHDACLWLLPEEFVNHVEGPTHEATGVLEHLGGLARTICHQV